MIKICEKLTDAINCEIFKCLRSFIHNTYIIIASAQSRRTKQNDVIIIIIKTLFLVFTFYKNKIHTLDLCPCVCVCQLFIYFPFSLYLIAVWLSLTYIYISISALRIN